MINMFNFGVPKKRYGAKVTLDGMTVEEAVQAGVYDSYAAFYQERNARLAEKISIFNASRTDDIFGRKIDYNPTYRANVGAAIRQAEGSYASTSYYKNDHTFYGFDTETLGNTAKPDATTAVTEIGLSRIVNTPNAPRQEDVVSIAMGVNSRQYSEFYDIATAMSKGVELKGDQNYIAERLIQYSGNFNDRFGAPSAKEVGFLSDMGINPDLMVVKSLNSKAVLSYDNVMSGLNNMKILGERYSIGSEAGNRVFEQAVGAISSLQESVRSGSDKSLIGYNLDFDVRVVNGIADYNNINAGLIENEYIDIMSALRIRAAADNMTPAELVQQIASKTTTTASFKTGGRLEDLARAVGIEEVFHSAGVDALTGLKIAEMDDLFMGEGIFDFINTAFDKNQDITKFSKEIDFNNTTWYFNQDIGYDTAQDVAVDALGNPKQHVPNAGRFWKVTGSGWTQYDDLNGNRQRRYAVEFQNATTLENSQGEKIIRMFSSEDELLTTLSRKAMPFTEGAITQAEIDEAQWHQDMDISRRTYDRMYNPSDVTYSGGKYEGGYADLVKYNKAWHDYTEKWDKKYEQGVDFKDEEILSEVVESNKYGFTDYDAKHFYNMEGLLSNEQEFTDYVISTIENDPLLSEKSIPEKTQIAKELRESFYQTIKDKGYVEQVDLSEASNAYAMGRSGSLGMNDVLYATVGDAQINVANLDIGTSQLERAFKGKNDFETIQNMSRAMDDLLTNRIMDRASSNIISSSIRNAIHESRANPTISPNTIASGYANALNEVYVKQALKQGFDVFSPKKFRELIGKVPEAAHARSLSPHEYLNLYAGYTDAALKNFSQDDITKAFSDDFNKRYGNLEYLETLYNKNTSATQEQRALSITGSAFMPPESHGRSDLITAGEILEGILPDFKQQTGRILEQAKRITTFSPIRDSRGGVYYGADIKDTLNSKIMSLSHRLGYNRYEAEGASITAALKSMFFGKGYSAILDDHYAPTGVSTSFFTPDGIKGAFVVMGQDDKSGKILSILSGLQKQSGLDKDRVLNAFDGIATVFHMPELITRDVGNGRTLTSIQQGGVERFIMSDVNYYETAGKKHIRFETPAQRLASLGYKTMGQIKRYTLAGDYEKAGKVYSRALNDLLTEEPGNVGRQAVYLPGRGYFQASLPNATDMSNANLVRVENLKNLIVDMAAETKDANAPIWKMLRPFVEEKGIGFRATEYNANRAVTDKRFQEFFLKHLNAAPFDDDALFRDHYAKMTYGAPGGNIGKGFESYMSNLKGKSILDLINEWAPPENSALDMKEVSEVVSTLRDGTEIFEALKEHHAYSSVISVGQEEGVIPIMQNQYAMWSPYNRPTNVQQWSFRYFNPEMESNAVLSDTKRPYIFGTGEPMTPNYAYEQMMARTKLTGEEGDIARLYNEKDIRVINRQLDDYKLASIYNQMDANIEKAGSIAKYLSVKDKGAAGLDPDRLTALYSMFKNEMSSSWEGEGLVRPSIAAAEAFSLPDISPVKIGNLSSMSEKSRGELVDRLRSNPMVQKGDILGYIDDYNKSKQIPITYNGPTGTVTNIGDMFRTDKMYVMPQVRGVGDFKGLLGDEKAMFHSIQYRSLYQENSGISSVFPELSKALREGKMTLPQAAAEIDPYTDAIYSALFGKQVGVVSNFNFNKHMTGSSIMGSRMNAIASVYQQTQDEQAMQSFVEMMNKSGFEEWNFAIKKNQKGELIFSYDQSFGGTKGYYQEMMDLERNLRDPGFKYGVTKGKRNVNLNAKAVKMLDYLDATGSTFTTLRKTVNQEKMGEAFTYDGRVRQVLLSQTSTGKLIPGLNALEVDGELKSVDQIGVDFIDRVILGTEKTLTKDQRANMLETANGRKVLQAMSTVLEYQGNPQKAAKDLAVAASIIDLDLKDISIPQNGASREELLSSIFSIHGTPSTFLKGQAYNAGKDPKDITVARILLGDDISLKVGKETTNAILIPFQDIQLSRGEGFYTSSQSAVVNLLNRINDYKRGVYSNETERMDALGKVQGAFDRMNKDLMTDLSTYKDSILSQVTQRQKTPYSGQVLGEIIDAPVLKEMSEKKWNGRSFYHEYNHILNKGLKNAAPDQYEAIRKANMLKAEAFKKTVLKDYADRIRGGEYLELSSGTDYKGQAYDEAFKRLDVYEHQTRVSRAVIEDTMGVDVGKIGMQTWDWLTNPAAELEHLDDFNGRWTHMESDDVEQRILEEYKRIRGKSLREDVDDLKIPIDEDMPEDYLLYKMAFDDDNVLMDKARSRLRAREAGARMQDNSPKSLLRNLNAKIKRKQGHKLYNEEVYNAIQQATEFLGVKYLKEVGLPGTDTRYPVFRPGSIVYTRILLDDTLAGLNEAARSAPYTASQQKLDLDGDTKFVQAFLDEYGYMPEIGSTEREAFIMKFEQMNRYNAETLAQLVEDTKFAQDPSNVDDFVTAVIKQTHPEIYSKYVEKVSGTVDVNGQQIAASIDYFSPDNMNRMVHEYDASYGNTLNDMSMRMTAIKSKENKSNVGAFSTSNYRIRQMLQDRQAAGNISEGKIKTIYDNLSRLADDDTLLVWTEQTGIDVKHHFGMTIAENQHWTEGLSLLMSDDFKTPLGRQKKVESALRLMLQATGAKKFNDLDYVQEGRHVLDAAYVMENTYAQIQEALDKAMDSGEKDRLKFLRELKVLEEISNDRLSRMMYSTNLTAAPKNYAEYLARKANLKEIYDLAPEVIEKGTSAWAESARTILDDSGVLSGVNAVKGELLVTNDLNPSLYMYRGVEKGVALFDKVLVDEDYYIDAGSNTKGIRLDNWGAEDRFNELFTKAPQTRTINDTIWYSSFDAPLDDMTDIVAVNRLTNLFSSPYEKTFDQSLKKKMPLYMETEKWLRRDYSNDKVNEMASDKVYGIVRALQFDDNDFSQIAQESGALQTQMMIARNAGFQAEDPKGMLRRMNQSLLETYKTNPNSMPTWEEAFDRFVSQELASGNQTRYDYIKGESSRLSKAGFSMKDDGELLNAYGSYRDGLLPIESAEFYMKANGIAEDRVAGFIEARQKANAENIAAMERTVFENLGSQDRVNAFFNWGDDVPLADRKVGFGSLLGYRLGDLQEKDIATVLNELTMDATDLSESQKYARDVVQRIINDYNDSNPEVKPGTILRIVEDIARDSETLSYVEREKMRQAYENIKKANEERAAKVAEQATTPAAGDVIEDATENMARRSLEKPKGMKFGGIGTTLGIGFMALTAIGMVNNIMNGSNQSSPLVPDKRRGSQEGGAVPNHNLKQATLSNKYIYTDPATGMNFKMSASSAKYMTSPESGFMVEGMNGTMTVNTTEDPSTITPGWLKEKMAELM